MVDTFRVTGGEIGKRRSYGTLHPIMRSLVGNPQKPFRRGYDQDATRVAQWRRKTCCAIEAKARRLRAKIFFR